MNTQYQTLIIGGGLSGLTVAHNLLYHNPRHSFLVMEKNSVTGGVIRSHHERGYITEIGPHGFLDNCDASRQLLTETGLENECIRAPLKDFVRYVYLHGKLNLIPQTPQKILMAPLIPWHAKLRIFAECWQPVLQGEPTVAKWINHRFGPALLPYVDAVYTGTYAGDFDRLTIDSVMAGVRSLEKKYGSVLRGLFSTMRKRKKSGHKGKRLSMPAMTSFPAGMQRLPDRLAEDLTPGKDLLVNTTVTAIQYDGQSWQISSTKGDFQAKNIIMALPVNQTLKLLRPIIPDIPVNSVPMARIATVACGFKDSVQLPPGFGFLTPEIEKRFSLGALFSSNMFPGRSPKGHIVFETLVGGKRHPKRLDLDDKTLTHLALADVKQILTLSEQPVYTTVLRSEGGIPQLEKDYPKLLSWKESSSKKHPGLHICGFGWGGIGVNDMIKNATGVAQAILNPATINGVTADIKGVYF